MISIVIPIYNVEQYLRRCLESVVAQTYTDWECILVDDGSPDKCGVICDEYAAKDSRFKVIHQENQGVTRARANGVACSKGDFITFVDADDTIPMDAIESLYSRMADTTDIVVGAINDDVLNEESCSIDEYRHRLLRQQGLSVGPVAKLFRRTLFTPFVFDIAREYKIGEDVLMNVRLAFNTEKDIVFCSKKVYNYSIHETSTTVLYIRDSDYALRYLREKRRSVPEKLQQRYMDSILYRSIYEYLEITNCRVCLSSEDRKFQSILNSEMRRIGAEYILGSIYFKLLFYVRSSVLRWLIFVGLHIVRRMPRV